MSLAPLRWLTATAELRALRAENAALRAERDALREQVHLRRQPRPVVRQQSVRQAPGIERVCEWGPATYAGARRR
jgi:cell division protein FtsB